MSELNILIPLCRLSYAFIWKPRKNDDGTDGKYGASLLIPKSDKKTVKKLRAAIALATENGVDECKGWKGRVPKGDKMNPLKDGDEKGEPGYEDHWYISATTTTPPGVVDKNRDDILKQTEIYSGVYCAATVKIYPYDKKSNGIGALLNNLMKIKNGPALAGKPNAEDDFKDFDAPDFDDEDEDDEEDERPVRKAKKKKRPVDDDDEDEV